MDRDRSKSDFYEGVHQIDASGVNLHPLFDSRWYAVTNPDLPEHAIELSHYMERGWREMRSPHPLFSVPYYLKTRPDVGNACIEPLGHFVSRGWRELSNPSPEFDTAFYLSQDPDLRDSDPLTHYLQYGWRLGLRPSRLFDAEKFLRTHPDAVDAGEEPLTYAVKHGIDMHYPEQSETGLALSRSPLVSVITTNRNGAHHLRDLFASFETQTYRNFEIIFVDDGSNDESVTLARELGAHRIVQNKESVGFAEANNVGLRYARGELIALINNDTRVDANWLETMVSRIMTDRRIAAVAPKIRFWTKFIRLDMKSDGAFCLCIEPLKRSLEYRKYFALVGELSGDRIRSTFDGVSYSIAMHLPVQHQPYSLVFDPLEALVSTQVGMKVRTISPSEKTTETKLALTRSQAAAGFFIINNAGSTETEPFEPVDRGFGEPEGGGYSAAETVDLFCGCSVLIRRDALRGMDLFPKEFVAYYEDSELGRRLRESGFKIIYDPYAIVYHKHSSTTVEHSLFWRIYTLRNRILYRYAYDVNNRSKVLHDADQHINHIRHYYENDPAATSTERALTAEIPQIQRDLRFIAGLIDANALVGRNAPRIGVFNMWWSTLGGGETHALAIADQLTRFGIVELISTVDFDLDELGTYFGQDTRNLRKRIVDEMTSGITKEYDLFVNSSYQNELPSLARHSLFLVSFPSRNPSAGFRRSYYFLANSGFTFAWMERYWGRDSFQGEVMSPAVPENMVLPDESFLKNKRRVVLSVGRFATTGHTKSQLEIAEAFALISRKYPAIVRGWKLVMMGSANDISYVDLVRRAAAGSDVQIIANATHEEVRQAYADATIYVHAAGFGRFQDEEPELLEHFGMTVAQALGAGCIPVVYDAGGPADVVKMAGVGFTFRTSDELQDRMLSLFKRDIADESMQQMRAALKASERYRSGCLSRQFSELLDRLGATDTLMGMRHEDPGQVWTS